MLKGEHGNAAQLAQPLQVVGAFFHHPKKGPLNGNVMEFGDAEETGQKYQTLQPVLLTSNASANSQDLLYV